MGSTLAETMQAGAIHFSWKRDVTYGVEAHSICRLQSQLTIPLFASDGVAADHAKAIAVGNSTMSVSCRQQQDITLLHLNPRMGFPVLRFVDIVVCASQQQRRTSSKNGQQFMRRRMVMALLEHWESPLRTPTSLLQPGIDLRTGEEFARTLLPKQSWQAVG